MSNKADIRAGIKKIFEGDDSANSVVCTIESVDLTAMTCYCIPVNGDPDILGVRIIAQVSTGFICIPTVGSRVVVSFLSDSTAYVAMTSAVSEIRLNGVNYGGIVRVSDLITQLNTLQSDINTLKTLTYAAISVYSAAIDGGVSANTFNAAVLPQINTSNLANTTVKHGNG